MRGLRSVAALLAAALALVTAVGPGPVAAASAAELDRDADAALARLHDSIPSTRQLTSQAKGVLVFPRVVKAGFMFGAQYGEGVLRRQGRTAGYYNTVAASYGFQAGAQGFGYVLFFMTDAALQHLEASAGFEVGTGPSIVVLDTGAARALTTTTLKSEVYAVIFDQRGLMGGVGLQGSKISRIDR